MSLHLSLSTPCTAAASLRGWQPAGMLVEFLYEGSHSSTELYGTEIGNHFNKDARNLAAVDSKAIRDSVFPQLHQSSGRYRLE